MLKRGFLASNLVYLSTKHSTKIINRYLFHLEHVFLKIKKTPISKIKKLLKGSVSHNTFKRLN